MVRKALRASGFRYREFVPVLNPLYHGKKGDFEVGMSWLDFCVWTGDKMFVILFDFLPMHGPKPYERQALESKKLFLEQRGVPYLVVPRTDTSQAYEVRIRNFARKEHP